MYNMSKDIKEILRSFDSIIDENKIFIDEVSASSSSLFGGSSVRIPADGAHKGQSGWQSNNAWDIPTAVNSPVYAVADGTVLTFSDYGPNAIHKDGKTLFGAGFTVDSANGLPDVYYTHLKNCTVGKGSQIKCGQLLGYVMDFPGSDYDHLHIGVEPGHNIKEFLNPDGTLKCGGTISGEASEPVQSTDASDTSTGTTSNTTTTDSDDDDEFGVNKINYNDIMFKKAKEMATQFGLNEEKVYGVFGDRISDRFGSLIIPAKTNSKIKSPTDGVIYSTHTDTNCKNQVVIEHEIEDRRYYLQFCNMTEPNVKHGRAISKGETLGKTSEDVKVSLFDTGWDKKDLISMMNKEINTPVKSLVNPKKKKDNNDDDDDKDKDKKEPTKYYDPIIPFIFKKMNDVIPSISKNKEGEKPKILNFFNKHSLSNKKVNEDIEKIKRLL
jgi:murein DD-endopeptidase MepM/ murein hydrolase activator NlpD